MLTHAEVRATMDTLPDVPVPRANRCRHSRVLVEEREKLFSDDEPLFDVTCQDCRHHYARIGRLPRGTF